MGLDSLDMFRSRMLSVFSRCLFVALTSAQGLSCIRIDHRPWKVGNLKRATWSNCRWCFFMDMKNENHWIYEHPMIYKRQKYCSTIRGKHVILFCCYKYWVFPDRVRQSKTGYPKVLVDTRKWFFIHSKQPRITSAFKRHDPFIHIDTFRISSYINPFFPAPFGAKDHCCVRCSVGVPQSAVVPATIVTLTRGTAWPTN